MKRAHKSLLKRFALAALIIFIGYLIYLDVTIQTKFDGKRWAIPARVYARPLDLYPGAAISAQQLETEIKLLGYRRAAETDAPATWNRASIG